MGGHLLFRDRLTSMDISVQGPAGAQLVPFYTVPFLNKKFTAYSARLALNVPSFRRKERKDVEDAAHRGGCGGARPVGIGSGT